MPTFSLSITAGIHITSAPPIRFSIARQAAWAPGLETPDAWRAWARAPTPIVAGAEAPVRAMPPMLRRRAGTLGKMALEVAFQGVDGAPEIPSVFCSRHGDVARAVELLSDLAQDAPLSPTGFGLAVHNAIAGLFSIARNDHANQIALAAGASSIEHAVIEACGLLAEGAPAVLLVAYDNSLPAIFAEYAECAEQPHAWAWLMVPAAAQVMQLSWSAAPEAVPAPLSSLPGSLDVLRFALSDARVFERVANRRRWRWSRDA